MCQYQFNRCMKICNSIFETLCSSGNFINSRQYHTITAIDDFKVTVHWDPRGQSTGINNRTQKWRHKANIEITSLILAFRVPTNFLCYHLRTFSSKGWNKRLQHSWGGFCGNFLGSLLKVGLPLMKNVLTQLTKSVLIPLELTAADTGIHKKVIGSGASGSGTTTLVTSNEEMKDIKKIVKCLEDSGLLFKEQRTKRWIPWYADEECTRTVSQKCFYTIRINISGCRDP